MFTRITARVSHLPQLKARNADTMHQVNTSARSTFFIAAKSSVQPQEVIHSKKSQKKGVRMIHLKWDYLLPFINYVQECTGYVENTCRSEASKGHCVIFPSPPLCHGPGDWYMPRCSRNAAFSCSFHSCTSTTTHLAPESLDLDF